MKILKIIATALISITVMLESVPSASAQEEVAGMLKDMPARSIIVYEGVTGQVLWEKNGEQVLEAGHLAKLMVLLIAAQKLEEGSISLQDQVSASSNAASAGGVSIWLEQGDKVTVEELIKSIAISNANDACIALAEHISGTEPVFVELMEQEAVALGLSSTHYADCTGMNPDTVTTALDTAKLMAALLEHRSVSSLTTVWLDQVRDGKAELVNHNRLVRTYKGMIGSKACVTDRTGECAVTAAEKAYLSPIVVVLGCDIQENCMDITEILLDKSFECYSQYLPELSEDMTAPIKVKGGTKDRVEVDFTDFDPVIIEKGSSHGAQLTLEKQELLKAPVEKGDTVGELTVRNGGEVIYHAELETTETVRKMDFWTAFFRLMCYLTNSK